MTAVATFFAPILFPPAPVLCFKEINNNLVLIATGKVLSCNPDRIILKRVVLSGYPLKIHKRSAVIRFMFFNREDINYYRVCELRTKMGRCGHIKQALGKIFYVGGFLKALIVNSISKSIIQHIIPTI